MKIIVIITIIAFFLFIIITIVILRTKYAKLFTRNQEAHVLSTETFEKDTFPEEKGLSNDDILQLHSGEKLPLDIINMNEKKAEIKQSKLFGQLI